MKGINKLLKCFNCREKIEHKTKDHIPPKLIFPKPERINLITVPSCKACNNSASLDDEYFGLCLSLHFQANSSSEILSKIYRSLKLPRKRLFANNFLKRLSIENINTPAGIYLGKEPCLQVNLNRLSTVINRTIKGLYFFNHKDILPEQCDVRSYFIGNCLNGGLSLKGKNYVNPFLEILLKENPTKIGNNTFVYWYKKSTDGPFSCLWLLLFYETMPFLGLITSKSKTV